MTTIELVNLIKNIRTFEDINGEEAKKIFPDVEFNIDKLKTYLKRWELSRFLYYVLHSLNRFSLPSPYYCEENDFSFFYNYLKIFKDIEKNHFDNILSLEMDCLYWKLFSEIKQSNQTDLYDFKDMYEDIDRNKSKIVASEKQKEYLEKCEKFNALFQGVLSKSLKTKVKCFIPMSPVKQRTIIDAIYEEDQIQIILEPKFNNEGVLSAEEGGVLIMNADSNWQNSECKVTIEIDGYKDLKVGKKSLYIEYESESLFQPKVFVYAFAILEKVFWKIQQNSKKDISNTLLEPTDIDRVTYEVKSKDFTLEWVMYPSAKSFSFEHIENREKKYRFNLNEDILWHLKCQHLATKYLSLGNTNLSLFWLNVGIESFFSYRISEMCKCNGVDENTLFREDYYKEVKELVKGQIPIEIFEKIKWSKDSVVKHFSLYKKISILHKNSFLKESKKKILRHYSNISKERNSLFHGIKTERVDSETILQASESYKWLLDNF